MTDEALQAELLANHQSPEVPETEDQDVASYQDAESSEEPQEIEENSTIDAPLGELFGGEPETVIETEDDSEDEKDLSSANVPLSTFLELKKELKNAQNALKNSSMATDSALQELAQEYDVDVDFMRKLADSIKQETAKEFQSKYEPMFNKQQQEREAEKRDALFTKVFEQAKKSYPELNDVLNKDLIKDLALDPKNSNKTVKQLIEWTYGGVINRIDETPAPSFEKGSSGSTKSSGLDFSNLSEQDHKAIANDPKLSKEYGDWVVKNVHW